MQKYFILLLSFIIFLLSCTSPNNPNNPNDQNNNNNNQSQRGEYQLLTDKNILSLSWSDKNKQEYFRTNWLNTFTNQIIVPAGVTGTTRKTDENATYMENDGKVLGKFMYATNIEWKGTNWIGALYLDERYTDSSKWLIFHIDTEGNLMNASGYGINKDGAPITDEQWKTSIYEKWGAFPLGTIKDFNYNQQQ